MGGQNWQLRRRPVTRVVRGGGRSGGGGAEITQVYTSQYNFFYTMSRQVIYILQYILNGIKETVDRCRQAVEVFDGEGKPTGEWKFDAGNAIKGFELLGKHVGLWEKKEIKTEKTLPTFEIRINKAQNEPA